MSEPIHRRDLFRLKPRPENRWLTTAEEPSGTTPPGPANLSRVSEPVNHAGMKLQELPPMNEASLLWEQVSELLSDIQNLASNIRLMEKSVGARPTALARGQPTAADTLASARAALESGRVNRLQVRYDWDGAHWIDTLERRDGAFRLVRIRHDPRRS